MAKARSLLALCLLVPALSIRVQQRLKQSVDLHMSVTSGMTPEVLCKDPAIVQRACNILTWEDSNSEVSEEKVSSYFVAEPSSIRKFWDAVGLAEPATCHQLCTKTLAYVKEGLGWPLPYFTNRQCTLWEYKQVGNSTMLLCKEAVLVSPEAMTVIAKQNDIPDEVQAEQDPEATHEDERYDMTVASGEPASPYLYYSVPELVERIANLFRVFPSEPNIESSSFMELDPVFHENVDRSQWEIWKQITAESRAWTDSVLQKFPLPMVKAFFGAEADADIQEVRRVLAGMVKTLDNMKIKNAETKDCVGDDGLPDGTKAFVLVSRDLERRFISSDRDGPWYVVNFCEFYWKPEIWSQPSSKFGTLVHESAHHHGPTDTKFRGSIPYGVAQTLRMASMSTEAAISNADNFMQFVYYVNRCWNQPRSSVPSTAPCSAKIFPSGDTVYMTPQCSKDVETATAKYEDPSGNTLKTHSNLGTWKASSTGSIRVPVEVGNVVKFFYEVDCMVFEGQVVYQGVAATIETKLVLDLSTGAGNNKPRQEEASTPQAVTVQSTGDTYSPHPSCHTECGTSSVSTTSTKVLFPQIAPNLCLTCEIAPKVSPRCKSSAMTNRTANFVPFTTINHQDLCCAELSCTKKMSASSQYEPGQAVSYYSLRQGAWFDARITKVSADGVEINLKQGELISNEDLPTRIKPRQVVSQTVDPCFNCPTDLPGCFAPRFMSIIQKTCMDAGRYVIDEATCTKQWGGKWCGLPRHS